MRTYEIETSAGTIEFETLEDAIAYADENGCERICEN